MLSEDEVFEVFELLGRMWRDGQKHHARILSYCLFRSTQNEFEQFAEL